ncbi:hypothetical protein IWQ47_001567 [Aquimarina sp. EL_43]|uniref:hypothetical protein n=1 Tax=Aquimarina TaxID=290174 RepID=UPI0004708809|nr:MULTISPECIES: hypothetical protein [Aquimarina]MBG6130350.1 hypothetical protein [Aquimarina sp. EL_35]MBG6149130.1 hypothetical protein [Aquimarina sp. EL_32]MBG6168496.1 hypothetical protein [Aquimarina sp. EL_43]
MKALKQIFTYLIWIAVSLILGIVYMRILLGPNKVPSEGLWYLFHIFYNLGLLHIGARIGGVMAFLFIILDVFYLKKKLKNNIQATITRFILLLGIAMIVGVVHYILEKVVDVI